MSNKRLNDAMASRSPIAKREAVTPVDMYTSPQVDKSASGEGDKPTNGHVDMTTNPQVDEGTSAQERKSTKPQVEKYTTHLRPETIKAIKRTALDRDLKDYEIVQRALDRFLLESNRGEAVGD